MAKIVVVGQSSFVLPFKAVGAVLYTVSDRRQTLDALDEVRSSNEPVVLLTSERTAAACRSELDDLRRSERAVVLVLSGDIDVPSSDYAELRTLVTHAAGVDLLERTSAEKE